ncbi:MAG: Ig-like domain-containing protein [Cyclobacteriaceae bacterium]
MKKLRFLLPVLLMGCIGEDIVLDEVDPVVQLVNPIVNLRISDSFQLDYMFLDNVGMPVTPTSITWVSSDESIATVNATGILMGLANGTVTISVSATTGDLEGEAEITFTVSDQPTELVISERTGVIRTTSSYVLSGDFLLRMEGDDLMLDISDNYRADTGLPGLFVYLSNNPNTISGAHEIAAVTTFSGEHSYTISNAGLFDYNYVLYYCKPFNVKVGDGTIE